MELDYSKIDTELLPALDDFPALEIDRGNIEKIRTLLLERAPLPSAVTVKEEDLKIVKADSEIPIVIFRKSSSPSQPAADLGTQEQGEQLGSAAWQTSKSNGC